MGWLKRLFKFEEWTYRELIVVVLGFTVLNLFAPRGFVQWILVQQDIRRVNVERVQTSERIQVIEDELRSFQRSDIIKEQLLRELGYLKDDELSLEFVATTRKNVSRGEADQKNSVPKSTVVR